MRLEWWTRTLRELYGRQIYPGSVGKEYEHWIATSMIDDHLLKHVKSWYTKALRY